MRKKLFLLRNRFIKFNLKKLFSAETSIYLTKRKVHIIIF